MALEEKIFGPDEEKKLLQEWEKEPFTFNSKSKNVFSIDTPPPYPSGAWHIGAVAHYSLIDMIARSARMRGREVLFPFCLDRNGINVERTVEKKFGKPLHAFDRQEFIDLCRQEIDKYSEEMVETAKRIGMSCDFEKAFYTTDSDEFRALSQATFIRLWNEGFVYEDLRPNNYCPHCRTTIAEAEVLREEIDTTLNFVKWKVRETGEEIIIPTTRPELICAVGVVLVNPGDARYKKLHRKHAVSPFGKEVEIVPHPAADPDFGTGILMECSYGDYMDISLFRELGLKPTVAIDERGKMTQAAGKYAGLSVQEARRQVTEDLESAGLIAKQEKLKSQVPICERSRTPIEFVSMKEYYVKQLEFKEDLKKMADKMQFHPPQHKQILLNWIDSLTIDWPVSRRRFFHTEIPVWYCENGHANVPKLAKPGSKPELKYYRPWKEKPPFEKCSQCNSTTFRGDERVFDTWMDSSMSPFFITHYLRDDAIFKKLFPVTVRPQGRDIVRTWLYYTLLKARLLGQEKPFEHVWISGMGLDAHGRKMSKSLGNIIEPMLIIEKHGADAFRFWAASEANAGEDFRISEDRIAGAAKFLTKLWNIARFVSGFKQEKKPKKLHHTDAWILAELEQLKKTCYAGFEDFNFFVPATQLREFVWNVFAPHYLEMAKSRAYDGDASACFALHASLQTILTLAAPIAPFVTDRVFSEVYGKSVHREKFDKITPTGTKPAGETGKTKEIIEFNSLVWKAKKEKNLALNAEISGIQVPIGLKDFEDDLRRMHKLA